MTEKGNKSEVAKKEEEILKFWQDNKIFQKSLEKDSPLGEFVFYDGPPYATGLPHYGHILPGTIKDVIPRYKTMRGYHVDRRWGWDCHGLPIENLIEKELNLNSKKEIEEYGIEKFNNAARDSVLRYEKDWKETIPRVGRWVDMKNDYKTMEPPYMESVLRAFKELYNKGLVSEGYKSMHLCPRCETTLANFEVNQGYKDIKDISVYAKFELVDEPGTFLLAWTTTPWTLPGNAALAVNEDLIYCQFEKEEEHFIVAKDLLESVFEGEVNIEKQYKGSDLVGKSYKPLFDYYSSQEDLENKENGWKVYGADFVTTEEGTGIVHIAPAFGDDDMNLGRVNNLPFIQHVEKNGDFKKEVTDFAGLKVKPKDDHQSTDIEIIKYLAGKGTLFAKKKIEHSYPHCWRCDTPLLNYASSSWFVEVPKYKDSLLKNNAKTKWVPENLRDGRFGKWLDGARDWAISRQRYWGAPLPIWRCHECEKVEVLGSVKEISAKMPTSGNKYLLLRHAESPSNVGQYIDSSPTANEGLTERGKEQAHEVASELKKEGIEVIIHSDFKRTTETAQIVASALGLSLESDARIRETNAGDFEDGVWSEWHSQFENGYDEYTKRPSSGENRSDIDRRVSEFFFDLEKKYQNKKILIVTHGMPIVQMHMIANGWHSIKEKVENDKSPYFYENAEYRELDFKPFPHNRDFQLDLHRPYIDEVTFPCSECEGEMSRTQDVFDVWFDSGSMPYGQHHYMFGDRKEDKKFDKYFPADFIAEGLDQTRGWFYSLMALSSGLFDKPAFEQVVVNGLVLAEDGKKMSKRLKNYPELGVVLDKYGADALRLFLMISSAVKAEDVLFSEKGVDEVLKKVMHRLRNVASFYELYKSDISPANNSENTLDVWILNRLYETGAQITESLEKYELDRGARPIFDFVDDLSTWYLRRSRDRFKKEGADKDNALKTIRFVLLEFSKLIAPYIPFVAEEIYERAGGELESVHLESWPETRDFDPVVLDEMGQARGIVSEALEQRASSGIKVRQPLGKLYIKDNLGDAHLEIIADEVNVKEVDIDPEMEGLTKLDTEITPELKEEGDLRDLIREVQVLRKEAGLKPSDEISVTVPEELKSVIEKFQDEFKETVSAKEIKFGSETKIN